jgi:hypothetical protein
MTKFEPGNTFSQGRKPGSRNKLQAVYFEDLLTVYGELGVEAMRVMAKEKPAEFIKLVGSHMPKELEIAQSPYHGITDEQLSVIDALIRSTLRDRAEREGGEDAALN